MVNFIVELLAKVVSIGMVLFQGILLDVYLVKFHNQLWWSWVIVDFLLLCSWVILMVMLWRAFNKRDLEVDSVDGRDPQKSPDEIRYAYIVWIVYSLCLVPRVVILFRKDASKLVELDLLGPNYLKVAVSCTPLIFMALAYALHDQKQVTARKYFVTSLVGTITLDLFDSIDLLEFLFEREDQILYPRPILDATLAFACINFFLPTLALLEIKKNRFNGEVSSISFKILYEGSYVFLVNIPNLVIRSVLWHKYNADVSVLIMKNIMCICLGASEILRHFGEERPIKCPICGKWYEQDCFKKHTEICEERETSPLNLNL